MTDDSLTPEQKRLLVWRDYFEFLQKGIMQSNRGREEEPWSEKDTQVSTWIDVIIIEIESDVMHIQTGAPQYCRWGDAKDLTSLDGNIDVSDE